MSSCNVTCVELNDAADPSSWPQGSPKSRCLWHRRMTFHPHSAFSSRIEESLQGKNADCSKVLIGFRATAYLTLIMVVIYYIVGFVPKEFLNSIDRGIIDNLWRKARSKPAETWEPLLRTAVLMFSDQQSVTGIAILASGYAQLSCGLSVYHWQMTVYLAWFSSLTHLATLTVLRQYFRKNPATRLWRAIRMLFMVTMLGIALLPTGDSWWIGPEETVAGLPALCYFKRLVAQKPQEGFEFDLFQASSMIVSVMVLFSGYLTRLVKLSKQATACTKRWIRTKPGGVLKDALKDAINRAGRSHANGYWRLKHLILETVYIILRASFDI